MAPLQTNVIVATWLIATLASASAFTSTPTRQFSQVKSLSALNSKSENVPNDKHGPTRRAFIATASSVVISGSLPSFADEDESSAPSVSFQDIAARAARVSQEVDEAEKVQKAKEEEDEERRRELAQKLKDDKRTIYDFTLPVGGVQKKVADLVGQTFESTIDGGEVGSKVKAILVVNIKQDDPIARKNIPELIALATK